MTDQEMEGRHYMCYSIVAGALEDERLFPESQLSEAEAYADSLATELGADCQEDWEVWLGVCYVVPSHIEGSQWAGEEPTMVAHGGGK